MAGSSRIEHLGVAQQRGGDREALAHSHRVALHPAVRRRRQADASSTSSTRRRGGCRRRRARAGGCGRCAPDGSSRPRAPRRPGRSGAAGPRSAARRRWPRPAFGVDQPEEHAQRGALTRPVGTEEAGDAARLDLEREVGHRAHLAEALAEPVDLHRSGHGQHPRRAPAGAHRAQGGTRPPTSG